MRLESERTALFAKSEDDCKEDVMIFLECHDPAKYRKKIKGFHLAFNVREKVLRIGEEDKPKYQFKNKLSAEEIKKHS